MISKVDDSILLKTIQYKKTGTEFFSVPVNCS